MTRMSKRGIAPGHALHKDLKRAEIHKPSSNTRLLDQGCQFCTREAHHHLVARRKRTRKALRANAAMGHPAILLNEAKMVEQSPPGSTMLST